MATREFAGAAARRRGGRRRRLTARQSALALMVSAAAGGLLTYVFWALLARRSGAAVVGQTSVQISIITFLASVSSLNLINVFARFLPEAGRHSRRLLLVGYGAIGVSATLSTIIFLSTPWSSMVPPGWSAHVGLVVAVFAMTIFLVQDGGLIGFGRAGWVPVENVAVGALRLALVAGLGVSTATGAVWAWAAPMAVAAIVVSSGLLGPLARAGRDATTTLPAPRQLVGFIAVESVTTAVSAAVSGFLPAIVSRTEGDVAAGYFYVPWLIASTTGVLLTSILIATVRQWVARPDAAMAAGQLRLLAVLLTGATVVCTALPQLPLWLLGGHFSGEASDLLRWIGASLPATAGCMTFWAVCLIDRRPVPLMLLNLGTTAGVIVGCVVVRGHGITAVGAAYCLVQWLALFVIAAPLAGRLRRLRAQATGLAKVTS